MTSPVSNPDDIDPSVRGAEVLSLGKVLEDAWRSVLFFQLTGQIDDKQPIRPTHLANFLKHPIPDLSKDGIMDYYARVFEIGAIEASSSQRVFPGDIPEYSYEDGARVIHERLNMTMTHLVGINEGISRSKFSDEELYEVITTLQTIQECDPHELQNFTLKLAQELEPWEMVTYDL